IGRTMSGFNLANLLPGLRPVRRQEAQDHGDLAATRPLFERALAISTKVLGPDHPDTATCLNSLALLHQYQGDLAAARPLFERALTIREKVLGREHPNTAVSLDNLARLLHDQGAGMLWVEHLLGDLWRALGAWSRRREVTAMSLERLLCDQGEVEASTFFA